MTVRYNVDDVISAYRNRFFKMPPDRAIATMMHERCRHNHVDQCDWEYLDWDELKSAHHSNQKKVHLRMAQGKIDSWEEAGGHVSALVEKEFARLLYYKLFEA